MRMTLGECGCACEQDECFVGKTITVDGVADVGMFNAPSFATVLAVAQAQIIDAVPFGQTKYIRINSSGAVVLESIGPGFVAGCQARKTSAMMTVQISKVVVAAGTNAERCCFCDFKQRYDIFGNLVSTVCNETVYRVIGGAYSCDVRGSSRTFDLVPEDPGSGYFLRSLGNGALGESPTCCFP